MPVYIRICVVAGRGVRRAGLTHLRTPNQGDQGEGVDTPATICQRFHRVRGLRPFPGRTRGGVADRRHHAGDRRGDAAPGGARRTAPAMSPPRAGATRRPIGRAVWVWACAPSLPAPGWRAGGWDGAGPWWGRSAAWPGGGGPGRRARCGGFDGGGQSRSCRGHRPRSRRSTWQHSQPVKRARPPGRRSTADEQTAARRAASAPDGS